MSPPPSRRGLRLAANVALVIGALLFVEGLSFALLHLLGLERYRTPVVENPHHPFLGWIHHPDITIAARNCGGPKSQLDTDAEGYSVTPLQAFPDPKLRIVMTGGSTVFGVGSSTSAHTVAANLEQIIFDELGVEAEVTNLGVRGYQSFQEMLALQRFATVHPFDLAIALSGNNDAYHGALEQNLQSTLLPANPHRTSEFLRRAERGELVISGVLPTLRRWSYTFDLLAQLTGSDDDWRRALGRQRSSERAPRLDDFTDLPRRAEISLTNYAMMDTIARQNRARFVMMLQPTLYTKAAETDAEARCSEAGAMTPEGLYHKRFEERFYEEFQRLPKPFEFVDATHALDVDAETGTYYVDRAHYGDAGAEVLARFVFDQVRGTLKELAARDVVKDPPIAPGAGRAPMIAGEDWLAGRSAGPR